jgi:CheY-like chemotaxis protein
MMPKKDGTKTYKELKSDPDLKDIPIKTLLARPSTGKVSPEGHLVKPVTAELLIREINKVLG